MSYQDDPLLTIRSLADGLVVQCTSISHAHCNADTKNVDGSAASLPSARCSDAHVATPRRIL